MKTNKLILATLIATTLSSISLYANAEQLTQKGFIKDFYTSVPQGNGEVKINLNLENQYSKRFILDNYTVKPTELISLDNLKNATTNNQEIEITYDDQSKTLINVKSLEEKTVSHFNKRSNRFKTGIWCGGGDIGQSWFYCAFTDNNNIPRQMVLVGISASFFGLGAFGGSISMDNLPTSMLTCEYKYVSVIFYHNISIKCPDGISGTVDAGGLKAPGYEDGKALILKDF